MIEKPFLVSKTFCGENKIKKEGVKEINKYYIMEGLPTEIIQIILDYIICIDGRSMAHKNVIKKGNHIAAICLINKEFKTLSEYNLKKIIKIFELIKKYNIYQEEYEFWGIGDFSPILYDAMLTGWVVPYSKSSFKIFNNEIKKDVYDMINLMPECIQCKFGQLRCRTEVTPFIAACYNPNIPMEIVELLLKNGAQPNDGVMVNGNKTNLIKELETTISKYRLNNIINLLTTIKCPDTKLPRLYHPLPHLESPLHPPSVHYEELLDNNISIPASNGYWLIEAFLRILYRGTP
jgi:hypothetical protein